MAGYTGSMFPPEEDFTPTMSMRARVGRLWFGVMLIVAGWVFPLSPAPMPQAPVPGPPQTRPHYAPSSHAGWWKTHKWRYMVTAPVHAIYVYKQDGFMIGDAWYEATPMYRPCKEDEADYKGRPESCSEVYKVSYIAEKDQEDPKFKKGDLIVEYVWHNWKVWNNQDAQPRDKPIQDVIDRVTERFGREYYREYDDTPKGRKKRAAESKGQ